VIEKASEREEQSDGRKKLVLASLAEWVQGSEAERLVQT